jgi:hypothetical protein
MHLCGSVVAKYKTTKALFLSRFNYNLCCISFPTSENGLVGMGVAGDGSCAGFLAINFFRSLIISGSGRCFRALEKVIS